MRGGGGGTQIRSAYARLHYELALQVIFKGEDRVFSSAPTRHREAARGIVSALPAADSATSGPMKLGVVGEGESERSPPRRDEVAHKGEKSGPTQCGLDRGQRPLCLHLGGHR